MAEHNNTDVIDGEVIDGAENDAPNQGDVSDAAPALSFGGKAILSLDEERALVQERIKEHEAAIARDELALFEAEVLGQPQDEVKSRIANSYALVQRYIDAYNARYGGSENG